MNKSLFGIVLLLLFAGIVAAHDLTESGLSPPLQLAKDLKDNSYNVVIATAILLVILIVYSIKTKPRKEKIKLFLFWSIAVLAAGSTLYLGLSTFYLNQVSPTGGPVHWHADFEVWNCGTKLDLVDPTGLDNKIGLPEVHEHNDDRMHIEGALLDLSHATFHEFFHIVGTEMDAQGMNYPTVNGDVFMPTQGMCNGQPAQLQGFLYHVTNPQDAKQWVYEQHKIEYPFDEQMAPYANVPPGDCLIVEFDVPKETTTHICASYPAAQHRGELHGR